jgi:parallel beta-helix repeat protein
MEKKLLARLMLLMLFISILSTINVSGSITAPTDPTVVYVDPATNTALPGQYFTISINVDGVEASKPLNFWEIKLEYNWEVLYTNKSLIQEGPFLAESQAGQDYGTLLVGPAVIPIHIQVGCLINGPDGAYGNGTLVTITFQIRGWGESVLHLYDTILHDPSNPYDPAGLIAHTTVDGYFSNIIKPVPGTVYIRADGSIDPSDAPIQRDGDLYTLTGNITSDADGIVIERNNITLDGAGYTVQGTRAYESTGIDLQARSNVTVMNMEIKAFESGIYLESSSNNSIVGSNITNNNCYGVWLSNSSKNSISGNNIANNGNYGVCLSKSSNNTISGNNIIANDMYGVCLSKSSNNNIVFRNNVVNNSIGIDIDESSFNDVVNNTVIYNLQLPYNGFGIVIESSFHEAVNNTIDGNFIKNCNIGVYIGPFSTGGYYIGVSRHNIVIGNTIINASEHPDDSGIYLYVADFNVVKTNVVTNSSTGVSLIGSCGNSIEDNRISNSSIGIELYWVLENFEREIFRSNNNTLSGNNLSSSAIGIILVDSHFNNIQGNFITNDTYGIGLFWSQNNVVYHCNFINNTYQVFIYDSYHNIWDNGYPSGGNYWSDYADADLYSGPNQDLLGMDGIWDHPYTIDADNEDRYPLVKPWPTIPAIIDVDPDSLNLRSKGQWITIYIQLPKGYSAADIDATTILLNGTIAPILDPKYGFVTKSSEHLVDHNNDGILERMVKFDRAEVESFITSQGIGYGKVPITVTGKLLNGTLFEGTGVIVVFCGGGGGRRK